jgi:DNA helicase-2/ATP-dependent DNA helicase PcrA
VLTPGRVASDSVTSHRSVVKKVFDSDHDMTLWLASAVQNLATVHAVSPENVAVLFRLNQTLYNVQTKLAELPLAKKEFPRLLTVHGSKGMEFDAVFLCDLEEGVFPRKHVLKERGSLLQKMEEMVGIVREDKNELAEEQRLFYVGVTRAKRFLWLVTVREKMLYGRTKNCVPSRFVRLVG